MIVRDEVANIIGQGVVEDVSLLVIADRVLLYLQKSIIAQFHPGAWRDTLHKSTAHEIVDYIINKGEAINP